MHFPAALALRLRSRKRAAFLRCLQESPELKKARLAALERLRRASIGSRLPMNIHERLTMGAQILANIDQRREEQDDPYVGLNIEEQIVALELRDLALATLANEVSAD